MKSLLFLNLIALFVALIAGNVTGNTESNYVKATVNYSDASDLDVYYDEATIIQKKPVVMHVHGGSWCEGSKDKEGFMGEFFQKNGFVSVVVNYRLYPETEYIDDMVEDIYKTIQWTLNNIAIYGGDASQFTLIGHSAGAHLATLTTVKAALGMEVNGITLKPFHLKHLIPLNGRHEIEEGDELLASIAQLRQLGNIPGLSFLANYAEAREHLLVGKSGYDQVKILKQYGDKSIEFLGAEKYTFVECDEDTVDPMGLSDPMIAQLERTVVNVSIDHRIYHGGHTYILDGIENHDAEIENELLDIVNSVY
ncbi:alpha/beta-hydrolase [Neocallimastix californiae]|uniref:Alpha/beta-hydrolase n=1 Tax=Neocallimastix californiae TaxID=1754190 RepID=A0A1Y2EU66_9FUNG|nr:alpha/beta-hydrolase [Neocallimastix californiae]|eukprot:ORY74716.1 alpha/beta-hydrolase [Neocallimastix californiae]